MVDLPEVIREVSLDLEPLIKSSGAELTVDIEDCPRSLSGKERALSDLQPALQCH
jgi:hypothetical protein